MKIQDLRIGNYYQYAGNSGIIYARVKGIKQNEFGFFSDLDGVNFGICKPIPITEEWLLKFGFLKKNATPSITRYFLNNFCIEFDPQDKFRFYYNGIYIEIHHVHQLQNLYFALTNNEL